MKSFIVDKFTLDIGYLEEDSPYPSTEQKSFITDLYKTTVRERILDLKEWTDRYCTGKIRTNIIKGEPYTDYSMGSRRCDFFIKLTFFEDKDVTWFILSEVYQEIHRRGYTKINENL